jgi:hypothetical protein
MKNIILKAKFLLIASVLFFVGCSKDDGPVKKEILNLIDAVPAISTAIDATGSQSINILSLASFQGKFSVKLYFADAKGPEKVDIVVRKNGAVGVNVKVFKANVTTLPANYTITAAEIQTLFGAPIVLGDTYDFSADIYENGKKYEAFPLGGVPNSSGPTGMPGYSHAVRYGAICAYDQNIYKGDFVVVSDGWDELTPGETITLTEVSASSFSFVYPSHAVNGGLNVPVIVKVNTNNNNVTIDRTVIGTTWPWANAIYTGAAIATTGAATTSFVAPCAQTVSLNINYLVSAGSFGSGILVLKKK